VADQAEEDDRKPGESKGPDDVQPMSHVRHPTAHRQARGEPLVEAGDRLVRGRELDAAVAPGGDAGGGALRVEPSRGVLDEDYAPTARKEPADGGVVADVGRDTEDDDPLGIERIEERFGVRVRE